MGKAFLTIILCFAIVSSFVVPTYAETAFADAAYSVDYIENSITVSADTAFPGTRVLVVVLNPDKALGDIAFEPVAALQYQTEITTDETGSFSVSVPLNLPAEPEDSVSYDVYAKIIGNTPENIISAEYKSQNDRFDILSKLKGGVDDIKSVLNDTDALASLGVATLPFGDELDMDALAATMQGEFSDCENTDEGFADAGKAVCELCVVSLFNQNIKAAVFDENGNYLLDNLLSLAGYDAENGTNLYDCYNTLITDDTRIKIGDALMSQNFADSEELHKKFAETVILKGMTNPKVTGYAHVEQLLTEKNMSLIGLKVDGKIDDNIEARLATASEFSTVKDMEGFIQDLIDSAADNKNNNNKKNNGGGGGGLGSISVQDGYFQQNVQPTQVFRDVPDGHWAVEAIAYLKAKGVVNGVNGDYFEPDSRVTREQLVKMIFAISDVELTEDFNVEFGDVDGSAWYAPYIATAVDAGYIKGFSTTEFGVDHYATRQDICTIVNRILNLIAAEDAEFTDKSEIADYALEAINALYGNGIINGYPDGSFAPTANCTRAEVATILYNAAKHLEVK